MTVTLERDLFTSMDGTYSLAELYAAVQASESMTDRAAGSEVIHGINDTRWKRRVRGAGCPRTWSRDNLNVVQAGEASLRNDVYPQRPPGGLPVGSPVCTT